MPCNLSMKPPPLLLEPWACWFWPVVLLLLVLALLPLPVRLLTKSMLICSCWVCDEEGNIEGVWGYVVSKCVPRRFVPAAQIYDVRRGVGGQDRRSSASHPQSKMEKLGQA